MKNLFKKAGSIIISLGDEGAILTCFSGDRLENRLFTASAFSNEVAEFFKNKEKYTVSILLDTIDQNFVFSSLPAVGSKNLNKIINRKLNTEFDKNDFNSYMFLGKEDNKARKDLKYVFLSVRNAPPLSEWLEFTGTLPNVFEGIYMIPVEGENFISKIKGIKKISKKTAEDWDILITQSRVGGFRQVVFKGGKLIFTRISQSLSIQSPDSVGLNISQETVNTLEYIRRIGYAEQPISVFIVSSKDSLPYIDIPAVNKQDVYHLSPFEIAQTLPIKNSALENDKFGDVVFASNFVNTKKILKLDTTGSKIARHFLLLKSTINFIFTAIIIGAPLLSFYLLFQGYQNSSKADQLNADIVTLQSKVNSAKDFEQEYKINPDFLSDVLRLDTMITDSELKDHLAIIKKFNEVTEGKFKIISFNTRNDAVNNAFEVQFRGNLIYNKEDVSDIYFKANEFQTLITKEFTGITVEISNLPSENNIKVGTIEAQKADIVIGVSIKGTKGIMATLTNPNDPNNPVNPNAPIAPQ